jgi:hypothetical protein
MSRVKTDKKYHSNEQQEIYYMNPCDFEKTKDEISRKIDQDIQKAFQFGYEMGRRDEREGVPPKFPERQFKKHEETYDVDEILGQK